MAKRVLLLHLDGKLPNIALMRIAAHHRALNHEIELRRAPTHTAVEPELGDAFDLVYASAIFERTRPVVERLLQVRPDAIVGGTGWDLRRTLEDVGITTRQQDYSIYPRFRQSVGFSQRGCRLRCDFCVVPGKEGAVRDEQTIAEIWRGDPHPREILLLDNDFFGAPTWRAHVEELRAGDFKVCFSQGINARMISDEAAAAIASLDYRDDSFKVRRIYTAWDNRRDETTLFRGLERLRAAGVKPDHVMVYMLIGYWPGETHDDREYRRRRVREWGARPYPMPYVRTRTRLRGIHPRTGTDTSTVCHLRLVALGASHHSQRRDRSNPSAAVRTVAPSAPGEDSRMTPRPWRRSFCAGSA